MCNAALLLRGKTRLRKQPLKCTKGTGCVIPDTTGTIRIRQAAKGYRTAPVCHAFVRVSALPDLGDYGERFSHNKDAELDYRLRAAGHRGRMSGKTFMVHRPRATMRALFGQHAAYGRRRAEHEASRHAKTTADDTAPGLSRRSPSFSGGTEPDGCRVGLPLSRRSGPSNLCRETQPFHPSRRYA